MPQVRVIVFQALGFSHIEVLPPSLNQIDFQRLLVHAYVDPSCLFWISFGAFLDPTVHIPAEESFKSCNSSRNVVNRDLLAESFSFEVLALQFQVA